MAAIGNEPQPESLYETETEMFLKEICSLSPAASLKMQPSTIISH